MEGGIVTGSGDEELAIFGAIIPPTTGTDQSEDVWATEGVVGEVWIWNLC